MKYRTEDFAHRFAMNKLFERIQPAKRNVFLKSGNEARDVVGDSRKRHRAVRTNQIAGFLPCPLRKTNNKYSAFEKRFREKACQNCKR